MLLRAGNPHHKGSGPGGGQFTSSGGGSASGTRHGKHFAKRQRRRKRKLEKLREQGHAKIAALKSKHAKERKALRTKHREKGASYSDRRTESQALRAQHRSEARQTVDALKKEARAAFPKSTGQSSKSKEYRERIEKGTQKLGAIHAEERSKMVDRHENERREQLKGHRDERRSIRDLHASERAATVADFNRYHREDAQYIIKETHGQPISDRVKQLQHNKEVHSGRLKDALKSQREDHAEEHAAHVDAAAQERRDLAKSHKDIRRHVDKAHKMERREAITRLKQEIQGRNYEFEELGQRSEWAATERLSLIRDRMGADPAKVVPKRFGRGRTHKAHSAEAMLRHVLRQRGWTAIYGDGGLSGRQHLNLLEDVRQYSRMYLRHEAESFFDQYGVEIEEESQDLGSGDSTGDPVISGNYAGMDADSGNIGFIHVGRSDVGIDGGDMRTGGVSIARGLAARAAGALSRFFDRARGFVREMIVAGAMALRGDDAFDENEQAALNHQVNIQRQYLDKFEREVRANPPREIADLSSQVVIAQPPAMTPGQFVARLEQYGNAAWQAAQRVHRGSAKRSQLAGGFVSERRILGQPKTEHCEDCPPIAQQGWVPIGTLPDIGDSECNGMCLCHFEYKSRDGRVFDGPLKEPAKLKLKRIPNVKPEPPKPAKPDRDFPNVPTLKELLEEAGSPFPEEEYEKA